MFTRSDRWLISFCLLAFAAEARADVIPEGQKWITPQVRFDNLGDYPDHEFYLTYSAGGGPVQYWLHHVLVVPARVPVAIPHGRVANVSLVAVPRGKAKPPAEPGKEEWPPKDMPGVLRSAPMDRLIGWRPISDPNNQYVTPYRVAVADGKLVLTPLPVEPPLADGWPARGPLLIAGAALACAIAGAGLWWLLARRRAPVP
jgi:hypothetical protein